jgi:hypothetical protein
MNEYEIVDWRLRSFNEEFSFCAREATIHTDAIRKQYPVSV